MRKRTQARECALKILYQIDLTKAKDPQQVLSDFWQVHAEDEAIKEYAPHDRAA